MKMKKIIPLTLLAAVSVNAAAQNVQDALRFSENNYYGTARSISMAMRSPHWEEIWVP